MVLRRRTVCGLQLAQLARCALLTLLSVACAREPDAPGHVCADARCGAPPPQVPELSAASGAPALCARPGADVIRDTFCKPVPPTLTGLRELQSLLGVDPELQGYKAPINGTLPFTNGLPAVNFVIALGHSTALSGHLVSPINPRVFFLTQDLVVAYQRGVQRVEIAVRARDRLGFNFYLLGFRQDCNAAPGGCKPGDLYTPSVERDWRGVSLQDDEDLKNSALDCRQCHARGRAEPQLLMRELQSPWTHFFLPLPDTPPVIKQPGVTGVDLTRDYVAAKGDEPYASASNSAMRHTPAATLEGLAGKEQPLVFDSETILRERYPGAKPGETPEPLPSPTWERGYEAFKRGEQLALPYVEPRATDPRKQAQLTEAYSRYRRGELSADMLPDLSDIFPDDPVLRARIGLQTEPDCAPADALIQACGSCHNDALDGSVSRARFNIDVSRLDRAELELAIERIQLPPHHPLVMPPREARQLEPGARKRLLAFLRDASAPARADPALQHAAARGMVSSAALPP